MTLTKISGMLMLVPPIAVKQNILLVDFMILSKKTNLIH